MKLVFTICVSLLCCLSNAQNNTIAGRTFLFTKYDSAATTISLFNTVQGGIYMKFQEAEIHYQIGNSYTSTYTQIKDSLFIKQPMSTLVAVGGFSGMLEHLMREKIWKPESVRKVRFSYQNDSLILVNGFGEKWVLVDSTVIQKRIESRSIIRLESALKEVFTVKSNSRERFYTSTKGDTGLVQNTWGKPFVYVANYSSSNPVNTSIDFDTLKLGEAAFNHIKIDKKSDFSVVLGTQTDGNTYLYLHNEVWGKSKPIIFALRFKYVNGQFEYLPYEDDSAETNFPVSAKVEYLKEKKINGHTYKRIYVLSYDLNLNTEMGLVRKCYWATGVGPIEFDFMNGEKLFLIKEDK